ncbi:serine-rich adhesin for platelets isoform X2 [Trichogramma pretiosum]|uniref:serine-rich adhesin for platelets isoform X2 n=1 Tax=Trichogramma pretiosum TaxID=7493 RepID=UPI0006C9D920|nr:serine-rich adhesin for platelets isoform X2 [Trichogramma pretiosum]
MEQFEQLLTCAICLDRYRNPKLLPCQHSFCMEPCMDGLVDYVRRQVKCPECRAEHRIPYQGVQAFPTNVTLQRFLELHIEITGELPDPTSGQIMERCSVCSEKSYCNTCAHCEKKCCPECKDEHVKILRKNIVSINSQVRRALHRLQETLAQVEKNTVALQTNAASVSEEVDEIYRRLNKALKDRTEVLRCEIDRYLGQELKSLIHLKENLEQEIANIQSNCDLADQHINENVPWDDNELLDTKELFLRTLEFIRNFEYEAGDYTRRMRFVMTHEPNQLVLHVAGYGELNIKPEGNTSALLGGVGGGGVGGSSSLTVPGSGGSPGLMRSKSDHRLASQYRSQQDDDRSHGRNRYVPDYEYDTPEYEAPRSRSRYRSRFMRNREGDDSDGGDGSGGQNTSTTSGRSGTSVRFNAPNSGGGDHHHHHSAREHRERVLDTEDASRGPLSGIFRLTDSPRVIKKLNECERAGKRKKSEQQTTQQQAAAAAAANQPKQQIQPGQGRNKSSTPFVGRQVSEDDEISRIKKLNKNAPGEPRQPTPAATAAAVQESLAEQERRAATPTSTSTSPAARRTTSRERDTELAEETSSSSSRKTPSSRKTSSELHGSGTGGVAGGRSNSSESTGSTESAGGGGSSIRSTGAPFTTEEMKQKFLARSPQNTSSSSATAGSLGSNRSSPVTSSAATTATTPRPFQSRFLGNRTTTPTPSTTTTPESKTSSSSNGSSSLTSTPAAVSKSRSEEEEDDDDEETSSSSEETESESEEDSEPEATPATPTRSSVPSSPLSTSGTGGGGYKRNESAMSRTDIGPLLARSAEARRGSKEDSPSTSRYGTPRSSPAQTTTPPASSTTASSSSAAASTTTPSSSSTSSTSTPGGYTSRFLNKSRSQAALNSSNNSTDSRNNQPSSNLSSRHDREIPEPLDLSSSSGASNQQDSSMSPRSRYAAIKERRQRLARSRSSHNFGGEDLDIEEDPPSPTTQSPNAYLAAKYGVGSELARSRSTHALKSREASPDRDRPGAEKDGAALSSWARYLKNKYGNRSSAKDKEPPSTASSMPSSRRVEDKISALSNLLKENKYRVGGRLGDKLNGASNSLNENKYHVGSSASSASRRLSLGLPLRHNAGQASFESSDDDQKNPSGSPTSPTAAPAIPAAAGSSTRGKYLLKQRQLFKFGMRGSEAGCFTWPRGLAVGPDNSIVVADSSNHRVQVFDGKGNFVREFGSYGSAEGEFDCLAGVAVNRIGQFIIADRYNHRIQVFDPSGRFLRAFGFQGSADGRFNYPWGITTDALGFIYVCDKENHRVQVFQSDGTFVGKFGSCGSGRGQLEHPHYIAVSSTNRVIVSDSNNHRVQIFDVNGQVLKAFGSEGSDEGQFKFPRGVAVDDQGFIVVADSGNNRVQIFTPEGAFLKAFGNWGCGDGEFKGLEGVAVTSAGNIVVCDRENHRVQIF